jgi:nucleotide-binding universal stress UspA family protein
VNTFIVGVDFSKPSKAAAKHARVIAKKLKAQIVFVYVYEDPVVAARSDLGFKKALDAAYSQKIKSAYRTSQNEMVLTRCGVAFEEILKVAKGFKKPFLVVADRGARSKVSKFFFGSTAERLALHSPYPVLIHKGNKANYPQRILIPSDFSNRSKNVVDGTKKLGLKGSIVEFFHVSVPPAPVLDYQAWAHMYEAVAENNARELEKFKKKYSSYKVTETESHDVVGNIVKQAKKFDVIAISPRDHTGMFASFGSVTSKLVRSSETSLLVVP